MSATSTIAVPDLLGAIQRLQATVESDCDRDDAAAAAAGCARCQRFAHRLVALVCSHKKRSGHAHAHAHELRSTIARYHDLMSCERYATTLVMFVKVMRAHLHLKPLYKALGRDALFRGVLMACRRGPDAVKVNAAFYAMVRNGTPVAREDASCMQRPQRWHSDGTAFRQ